MLATGSTIACGGEPAPPGELDRDIEAAVVAPKSATAVSGDATQWCQTPTTTASDFVPLDKEKFISLVADDAVGWMAPLHEVLLGVDEQGLLDGLFETIQASHETSCNANQTWGQFPPNESLIDPENQADFRREVVDLLTEAVEVAAGDELRLTFQ